MATNEGLQDALDHALREMESVRQAVAAQARTSEELRPAAAAAASQQLAGGTHTGTLTSASDAPSSDDAWYKTQRIRELQRELAAVLKERDAFQAHLEALQDVAWERCVPPCCCAPSTIMMRYT